MLFRFIRRLAAWQTLAGASLADGMRKSPAAETEYPIECSEIDAEGFDMTSLEKFGIRASLALGCLSLLISGFAVYYAHSQAKSPKDQVDAANKQAQPANKQVEAPLEQNEVEAKATAG